VGCDLFHNRFSNNRGIILAQAMTVAQGFLFGTGLILAAMLFKAVLHTGFCG
jgi:hypothetical protein